MSLFYLAIGLRLVRWSPNLPYAHKCTKLSDVVAFKVGHSVVQELDWCSEDWDITLPQKLSNSFHSLIRIMYAMMCFLKWLQKTKRFPMFRGWSNSFIVSIQVKSTCNNSKGVVTMLSHIGALAHMPSCCMHHSQLLITLCIWQAMLSHQNQSFRSTVPAVALGVQHHGDIHSWQLPSEPWWPQITKLPPVCQLGCGNGKGLLGRALVSSTLGK